MAAIAGIACWLSPIRLVSCWTHPWLTVAAAADVISQATWSILQCTADNGPFEQLIMKPAEFARHEWSEVWHTTHFTHAEQMNDDECSRAWW